MSLVPYHAIQVTVLFVSIFVNIQSQLHRAREGTGINEVSVEREPLTHLLLVKFEMHSRKASLLPHLLHRHKTEACSVEE